MSESSGHRSCKCGAVYDRSEHMVAEREISSFKCAVCGETIENWNTTWVPRFRFIAATNLRRTEGHFFRKTSNFFGTDRGPKIFAIRSGHISRLTSGERVCLRTAPASTAGPDKATTSRRKVGVHTTLRGRSLWPNPGRSKTMTR